jgi:hypothetical protein
VWVIVSSYYKSVHILLYQQPEIQERSLRDREAVLTRLQMFNNMRCERNPVYGQGLIERCEVLPPRDKGRRLRSGPQRRVRSSSSLLIFDHENEGRFHLGYGEVYRVVLSKLRDSLALLPNSPKSLDMTTGLAGMVMTLEERLKDLGDILNRFVIFIPPVAAPKLQSRVYNPSQSRYAQKLYLEDEMRMRLSEPTRLLHPIVSLMSTQFPDPRLIGYDCGKLQRLTE